MMKEFDDLWMYGWFVTHFQKLVVGKLVIVRLLVFVHDAVYDKDISFGWRSSLSP